ncbi:hypothetical protein GCM10029976_087980 [Kribbella albertanoniae]|uniref:HicB family toxin-antitoxin system n=1 Tax=Kribbella albertanoniae TaxID=1266829 RepID=A0A4R4PPW3_9ACTN|nr:hypothetical protein [Kribbella albertanoniae]TDC24301.1 hypothetical protein E1261_26460 [Kribbella albertanoniae]
MKTYEATVAREGRWWMVEIPELDGLTQARRLDEVEQAAREYVAVTVDVPMSQVAVEISGIEAAGHDLLDAKTLVEDLRTQAGRLESLVADFSRELAAVLTDADVPVRDVSKVLGVSHQRVSQLVQESEGVTSGLADVVRQINAQPDLVIHGKDGRVLRIVEVVSAKSAEAGPIADPPRPAARSPRKRAAAKSSKRGKRLAAVPTSDEG